MWKVHKLSVQISPFNTLRVVLEGAQNISSTTDLPEEAGGLNTLGKLPVVLCGALQVKRLAFTFSSYGPEHKEAVSPIKRQIFFPTHCKRENAIVSQRRLTRQVHKPRGRRLPGHFQRNVMEESHQNILSIDANQAVLGC